MIRLYTVLFFVPSPGYHWINYRKMLSISKSPPLVSLSGNPIRFGFLSDNSRETAWVDSMLNIYFTDNAAAGDKMTILWLNEAIEFVFTGDPDHSGNQLPDGTVIADLYDWADAVCECLNANYYINRDWVATLVTGEISLTSRAHVACTPSVNFTWADAGHIPATGFQTGTLATFRIFFKVGIQLLLNISGTWTRVAEDVLPPGSNGEALFDIHSLFGDHAFPEFKFPEASDLIIQPRMNSCIEYRLAYFERYGSPVVAGKVMQTSSYYALFGGVSLLQMAIYNRKASSFWAKLTYNQYFLTWSPLEKPVDRYSTEKLYFLTRTLYSTLRLIIEINYNNGTPKSTITKTAVSSPLEMTVYEIVCSLNTLQLSGYDTGTIDFYRVWMEDEAENRISEIRTYRMDYEYHEQVREFLFLNSLGGYDTLRITGDVSDELQYDRTTITKVLGPDFTEMDHQQAIGTVRETRIHTANTGWLNREQLAWVRDFFLSKQVYQLIYGKLLPVVVSTKEAKQRTDREELYSIEFEYSRAYSSEYYTREIVVAEFGNDFNDDFPNE